MKIKHVPLLSILLLAITPSAQASKRAPNHLDTFSIRAEYIVVATCTADRRTVKPDAGGGDVAAMIEVERVFKAPKNNPKPTELKITGSASYVTRFPYQKGRRYFVFVFKNGFADRPGSRIEIGKDGKLDEPISGHLTGELICLEKNTDTLDKLTRQVESVLSGKYEKKLIANIRSKELGYDVRRTDAIALGRTYPKSAAKPLRTLLLEISKEPDIDGSTREVFLKLLSLDPNQAKELSLQILSSTSSFVLYFEAAEILARPVCKLADFEEHSPMLIKAANAWQKSNPGAGYAHMLPVFINNDCRSPEVKRMLLAQLASPKADYFVRTCESTIKLQFPGSVPLFRRYVKKQRLVSGLEHLNHLIASYVGASTVYPREKVPQLTVHDGKRLVRISFAAYRKSVDDADVIRVDKALLFFIGSDDSPKQTCLYVGFLRKHNRIERKVFVLFGGK